MKTTIQIKLPRQRSRAHRVLFDENSPFKPKVVQSKLQYSRRAKHPKRDADAF